MAGRVRVTLERQSRDFGSTRWRPGLTKVRLGALQEGCHNCSTGRGGQEAFPRAVHGRLPGEPWYSGTDSAPAEDGDVPDE